MGRYGHDLADKTFGRFDRRALADTRNGTFADADRSIRVGSASAEGKNLGGDALDVGAPGITEGPPQTVVFGGKFLVLAVFERKSRDRPFKTPVFSRRARAVESAGDTGRDVP